MNRLLSLDKKLVIIKHRLNNEQLSRLVMPREELEKQIRNEMSMQTAGILLQKSSIKSKQTPDGVEWLYSMFILNEVELLNVLKETLELNEDDRQKTLADVNRALGIFR